MIITDAPVDYHGKFKGCSHMISDLVGQAGRDELMAFARRIGMRPEWLQKPGTKHEHFDIFGERRNRALRAGCVEVDRKRMVEVFRAKAAFIRAAIGADGDDVNYKGHTIKVDPFRHAFVVTVTGPLIPCSRSGTFATQPQAIVYAKQKIDDAHRETEQRP